MRNRKLKVGLVAATALSAALPLLAVEPAYADYAPSKTDVVGVGSDTLQYLIDFLADGDAYGTAGYNNVGNKNKLISFDATPDVNARQGYGVDGGQSNQSTCSPGTGTTAGTGNSTTSNTGTPCVLNPTIVLRAGTQPVQRPNGSGGGFTAIEDDINAGTEEINFSRASSALGSANGAKYSLDSVEVAQDTLPIIKSSSGSHAVALSASELNNIYNATTTSVNAYGGTGCVTWNELPGNSSGSTDTIIPIVPQVGSGTRKFFLQQIQNTSGTPTNPGNCAVVAEENDPTAIADQGSVVEPMGEQGSAADAIEPISQGRLFLYLGENYLGANQGIGGYFLDPSCAYKANTAACGTVGSSASQYVPNSVNPPVSVVTGAPGDDNALFDSVRPLYIYFRASDLASTTPFQPGGTLNWLRTLFYNPCATGESGCTTDSNGNTYGPGGAPYVDGPGAPALEDAGVAPVNTATSFTADGP